METSVVRAVMGAVAGTAFVGAMAALDARDGQVPMSFCCAAVDMLQRHSSTSRTSVSHLVSRLTLCHQEQFVGPVAQPKKELAKKLETPGTVLFLQTADSVA